MLDCLERAHIAGILHGDVKPSHVFLTGSGSVKLLDFGISFAREAIGASQGKVVGVPWYMAPERLQGLNSSVDRTCRRVLGWSMPVRSFVGRLVHQSREELLQPATSLAQVVSGQPTEVVALVDHALSVRSPSKISQGVSDAARHALRAQHDQERTDCAGGPALDSARKPANAIATTGPVVKFAAAGPPDAAKLPAVCV